MTTTEFSSGGPPSGGWRCRRKGLPLPLASADGRLVFALGFAATRSAITAPALSFFAALIADFALPISIFAPSPSIFSSAVAIFVMATAICLSAPAIFSLCSARARLKSPCFLAEVGYGNGVGAFSAAFSCPGEAASHAMAGRLAPLQ